MNIKRSILTTVAAAAFISATGCFRVSSETQALRNAALEAVDADEKIELGVGFFTVRLARFGTQFFDLPREAKLVLESVDGAECSVYDLQGKKPDSATVLARADKAMEKRGLERVLGLAERDDLVAVYIPRSTKSHGNIHLSVLVLNREQLICVGARGDLEPIAQIALEQMREHLPAKPRVAAAF
jgi:hypothetical protein